MGPYRMHVAARDSAASAILPLEEGEIARADQVARRLYAELRAVVAMLPEPERAASAMSRALSLDRATCQRIVGTLSRTEADTSSLVQFPGVMGLRQFVEAVGGRFRGGAEQLAAAGAAIDLFEKFLDDVGGSQRKLKERLLARDAAHPPYADREAPLGSDDVGSREALFNIAAGITGRWTDTLVAIRAIRPTPADARKTEEIHVMGLIGHMSRAEAVPLFIGIDTSLVPDNLEVPAFSTLDAKPVTGATPSSILTGYSSDPLPRVTSRSVGGRVVQLIDTPETAREHPVDVVIASKSAVPEAHPAVHRPPIGEIWTLQTFPARRLLFDVYLHRDLASRCQASLELHLWQPNVGHQGLLRWCTRFPGGPKLHMLGQGLSGAASRAYARQQDLTRHAFQKAGWESDEFVGYRCEIEFPVWRAGYCMAFDFTGHEM